MWVTRTLPYCKNILQPQKTCNNIEKRLVILSNSRMCHYTLVFHSLTENLKKDRAHVLSQDSACTARTQMLSERWWIRLNLYARFLAQTSFFLWHIFVMFFVHFLRNNFISNCPTFYDSSYGGNLISAKSKGQGRYGQIQVKYIVCHAAH